MDCEHEWQEVCTKPEEREESEKGEESTESPYTSQMRRMKVPGGWLYICESRVCHGTYRSSVAMEFVPDPPKKAKVKVKRGLRRNQ